MVKVNIQVKTFLPTKVFLASGYAPVNVSTRLAKVPKQVYIVEFTKPISRSRSLIICSYPFNVGLTGQNSTLPAITLAGELRDCAATFNNGNNVKIKHKIRKVLFTQ